MTLVRRRRQPARSQSAAIGPIHRRELVRRERGAEPQVAGKHLVTAIAGKRHGHVLARQLRDQVAWESRMNPRMARRGDRSACRAGRSPTAARETRCDGCRTSRPWPGATIGLVECRVALETDTEGAHRFAHQSAHQRDDDRRVDAAAEETRRAGTSLIRRRSTAAVTSSRTRAAASSNDGDGPRAARRETSAASIGARPRAISSRS